MNIEIHDAALEARIRKQIQAIGSANAEDALLHLLEQEEQDRWLIDNRDAINSKIRRGIAQLERGEGILKTAWMLTWPNKRRSRNRCGAAFSRRKPRSISLKSGVI